MRYAFAGDRQISCNILNFIMGRGFKPSALLIGDRTTSSHVSKLKKISGLGENLIFYGKEFQNPQNITLLEEMGLDYIFGIHFPYIIPKRILDIPKIGFLNLHPAYLPYNKGWHTPSWAIIDGTPYGATLHFMTEALDKGDIIHQKELPVLIEDTADSLYQKVLKLEEEVFYEAFEDLSKRIPGRISQTERGSSHNKNDLSKVQEIDIMKEIKPLEFINKLRALTTNKTSELAYFRVQGKKIGIKVSLIEMNGESKSETEIGK